MTPDIYLAVRSIVFKLTKGDAPDTAQMNAGVREMITEALKADGVEEKAFYDILKALAVKYDFTYPEDKLLELAKAVKVVVEDKVKYTDWSQRDDIKAELKVGLILVLAEHGYPR